MKNKFLSNTSWIVGGRVFQMILNLFITMITARYLGPSNYGLLDYTLVYTTLFSAIAGLGINAVIVKEIISHREDEGEIMGTAIVMKFIAGIFSMISIFLVAKYIIGKDNPLIISIAFLQSIQLIFTSLDTIAFWYQSNLQSKIATIIQSVAYVIMSVYKIIILILNKDVTWFAFTQSLDFIVIGILLLWSYNLNKKQNLSFNKKWVKVLLSLSYPFILSALMSTVYNQIGKLMIGSMMDEYNVGLYSAAVAITSLWSFIPVAFIDSARPIIMELKDKDEALYKRRLKQLYAFILWMSFACALVITIFSKYILLILYGKDYLPAQLTLSITVWYAAFSYLGAAKNIWIVCERKMKYEALFTFLGAGFNIVLNLILIPRWGIIGAAITSVLTQMFTNFVIQFLFEDTRENAFLTLEAIFLKDVIDKDTIKHLLRRK